MPRPAWLPPHRRPKDPFARAQLAPLKRPAPCVFADSGVRNANKQRICSNCQMPFENRRHQLNPQPAESREIDARRLGEATES